MMIDNQTSVAAKFKEIQHFQNNFEELESIDEDQQDNQNNFIEEASTNVEVKKALKILKWDYIITLIYPEKQYMYKLLLIF